MSQASDRLGTSGAAEDSSQSEQEPAFPLAGDTPYSRRQSIVRLAPPDAPAQRAEVRSAYELEPDDLRAVQTSLERHFGHHLQLDLIQDASVIGGVWVRVGDIVIDGSLRGRLEALRHHLRAQCRAMVSSGLVDYGGEAPTQ